MPRILFAFVLTLAIAIGGGFPQSAFAKSKSSQKTNEGKPNAAAILAAFEQGGIKWGQTKAQVIEVLLNNALENVRSNPNNQGDRMRMQNELDNARSRARKAEESYTEFTKKSNFGSSVISEEYIPDHNESFIRFDDDRFQKYFFFYRGRLYKLVIVFNRNDLLSREKEDSTNGDSTLPSDDKDSTNGDGRRPRIMPFYAFAAKLASKYGDESRRFDCDDEDEALEEDDDFTCVQWDTPDVILLARDSSRFFGTYVETFVQPTTYGAWKTAKRVYDSSQKSTTQVSAQVRSLIDHGDSSSAPAEANSALSDMLGVGDIQLDRSIAKFSDQKENTSLADAAAKKQAEAKKNIKKKAKKKKHKRKVNLGDFAADSGKGLVIC